MKFKHFFVAAGILATTIQSIQAQCTIVASAQSTTIPCNGSTILSVNGSGTSQVAFSETFNSGVPIGWQFSQTVTIANNTCGVPSLDGTDFMWMGNQSVAPRVMATVPLDVSAGGTVCFEMRYAIQAQASPCEGPDLASEGVYLQYSIDNGATWTTMNYWSPNGGYDSYMTAWNQYCENIPLAAQTATTKFRWTQLAVSGAPYDHWGLDNISISASIPSYTITWLHDNYSYPTGVYTGNNPTPVSPTGTTSYIVMMTDSTNTCYDTITLTISYPQIDNILETNPTCGSSNGILDASASGGAGGTIYWQNTTSNGTSTTTPATTRNVTSTGTYYFRSQSPQGCWGPQGSAAVTIVSSITLTTGGGTTQSTCGASNGTACISATGGNPPYTYSWAGGGSAACASAFII